MIKKYTNIPCNGEFTVTYLYGEYDRKLNKTSDGKHHGTDLVIANGQVISASEGVVDFAGWDNLGYGLLVIVKNGNEKYYYGHLSEIHVKVGQKVNYTTQIGIQGMSGNATGIHLHFERRIDNVPVDSGDYMGIPRSYGTFNSYNYVICEEINEKPQISHKNNNYKYKVGDLVVFNKYHNTRDSRIDIDCMINHGSWLQGYIEEIVDGENPYRSTYDRYLNDDDIKELK